MIEGGEGDDSRTQFAVIGGLGITANANQTFLSRRSASPPRLGLSSGTRHEAANLRCTIGFPVRPNHGRTKAVRLGYNREVRHDKPLPINSHPIVPILSVPVDILHTEAVGKGTAQASSACEAVEPRLKRRICKSAIVSCGQLDWHQYRRQAKRKDCQTDESAHRGLRQEVPRVR